MPLAGWGYKKGRFCATRRSLDRLEEQKGPFLLRAAASACGDAFPKEGEVSSEGIVRENLSQAGGEALRSGH